MSTESTDVLALLTEVKATLTEVREELRDLRAQRTAAKEWLTTREFASVTGISDDYVRELCRAGRLRFRRTQGGRGGKPEFRLSKVELARFQSDGPLRAASRQ